MNEQPTHLRDFHAALAAEGFEEGEIGSLEGPSIWHMWGPDHTGTLVGWTSTGEIAGDGATTKPPPPGVATPDDPPPPGGKDGPAEEPPPYTMADLIGDIQVALQEHAAKHAEPAGEVIHLDFIAAAPTIAKALCYIARDIEAMGGPDAAAPYVALAMALSRLPDSGLKQLLAIVLTAFAGDEEACLTKSLTPWLVGHAEGLEAVLDRARELAALEDAERAKDAAGKAPGTSAKLRPEATDPDVMSVGPVIGIWIVQRVVRAWRWMAEFGRFFGFRRAS